ncbi:MAG: bifunctional transcriptional activator/DNA repair protein Ada [Verrucomicrobia bacterium]|nr:bifunctional transcriptional activator/DNA repair protein Ada [Verrucomicrobiota bacterium]
MERAWRTRDATYDGVFFVAVTTTGTFCRPSCSARPNREHLQFFRSVREAVSAGYRPCKRCRPELANGQPPGWVTALMGAVAASPEDRFPAPRLRSLGVAPERARRWFQQHYGMTFATWCRGLRLSAAFTRIRRGEPLDDVILGHGYESHSGFRDAFARTFGRPPGKAALADCIRISWFETPLGPMLAAATNQGICLLEFADRRGLEGTYADMRRRFDLPVVPGLDDFLNALQQELQAYFAGSLHEFRVAVVLRGTPFQERVWRELQGIPMGTTQSYEEVARRIGQPKAVRAVARANGMNRICLLVPCHRVIAKDGSLSGYGGGVWRKRFLLELERTGKLPGRDSGVQSSLKAINSSR